ncbi:hypothetical protein [Alkalilacustris brevis]|uniref:hypothetical protein n=1 Tax=Alkalilacustris brevis TaxID=2026338 RepID=UPI0012D31A9B|nr:hypothetical protein [Alkalilacustris brevis]
MIRFVALEIFSVTRVSTVKSQNAIQPLMNHLVGGAVLRKVDGVQPAAMAPGLIQKNGGWGIPGSLLKLGQHCTRENHEFRNALGFVNVLPDPWKT